MPAAARRINFGITDPRPARYRQYDDPYHVQMRPVATFGALPRGQRYARPIALGVQQMVSALREGGMPVSGIAEAMKVERKTIYSWLDGGEVREANIQRAITVHSLLTGVPGLDVRSIYRFWNTPAAGRTLRDLICAAAIDDKLIRSTLELLRPAAEKARDTERKMSRKGAENPVLDGIPEAFGYS